MKIKNKYIIALIAVLMSASFSNGEERKAAGINEFKSALKKSLPGDVIILADGEWRNVNLVFSAKGTHEKPIILKSETAGKVILTGSSTLKISGEYLIVDGLFFKAGALTGGAVIEFRKNDNETAQHCRLTNCAIVDYNPSSNETEYKWVSLYGENNRVDHCYFRNKTNLGCLLVVWLAEKPNYHLIDSNYFAFRPELGVNGAEIIRIGTSQWSMFNSSTTVEFNLFEQCNGEREIISNKSFYNIYRYNTFVECRGTLTLRHGNNCTVEGNYFFGNNVPGTGGIRIIGEGHKVYNNYLADLEGEEVFAAISFMNGVPNSPANRYFQVKNCIVAFNTLVNNRQGVAIGAGKDDELSLSPVNCSIAGNIIVSNKGKLLNFISKPENFTWECNILWGKNIDFNFPGIKFSNPLLKKENDNLYRPDSIVADLFCSYSGYEFVKNDIDGQPRTGIKCAGCDQPLNQPVKINPVTPKETGPKWFFESFIKNEK